MIETQWQRVSKRHPCKICGRSGWCTFQGPADNPDAACCMRVESGKVMKNGGWLHRLREVNTPRPRALRRVVRVHDRQPDEKPTLDFTAMARGFERAATTEALNKLAASLGVSAQSLERLAVGWSFKHRAWTFPMSGAAGEVVGIRLRLTDGKKLSVRGGREGLFLPEGLQPGGRLTITEGPTDCAAILDLGFPTVGRPSCCGGVRHLTELVKRLRPEETVIIADDDGPGRNGANTLAERLAAYCPIVRVVTPPAGLKDARQWVQRGATAADVQAAIDATPIRRLAITTATRRRKAGATHGQ